MQSSFFKKLSCAATLSLVAGSAFAAPVNLIQNGSFESGLAGWTQGGSPTTSTPTANPIAAITYGSASAYPTGAFGEAVPTPNDTTLSPDAAGSRGAYFVDDNAINQSLTQSVFLAAGNYRIGFDIYAPSNGYSNPFDATFSAQIGGIQLLNSAVSGLPSTTWTNFSGLLSILNSGFYTASFNFNTPGRGAAKDVVVDRVYVVATAETGGQPIPEPGSLALVGLALVGLAVARKRKTS